LSKRNLPSLQSFIHFNCFQHSPLTSKQSSGLPTVKKIRHVGSKCVFESPTKCCPI
jgi:hypothetical protein